ncbi:hypothetical protein IKT18_01765 [Candidatus Saccharibacteria bacterium]|nr:hypothetical protein [Candidatus Saccharibacteria bacterium]
MEQNQTGAQPAPNQPTPTQPAAPAMTMEEQVAAAVTETAPEQTVTQDTAPANEAEAPKKKSKVGALLAIVFAIAAIGGIGFGVMMMMQKDNQAKNYETQISSLKKSNAELTEQLADVALINGDEALALMKAKVTADSLPYNILNANVYAVYDGEEEETSYWIKMVYSLAAADTVMLTSNVIFTLDEDTEKWDFDLPGFITISDETAKEYKVLE